MAVYVINPGINQNPPPVNFMIKIHQDEARTYNLKPYSILNTAQQSHQQSQTQTKYTQDQKKIKNLVMSFR